MNKILRLIVLLPFLLQGQEVDISNIDSANLTSQQVEQIKASIEQSGDVQAESAEFNEEESLESKILLENPDPAKFGYNFLNKTPTTITPVNDLPIPNDYVISLRDELSIILSGSRDQTLNLRVLLDGNIQFPELGLIPVVGETLQEVRGKLTSMVSNLYLGTKVSVSIRSLSAKKITIIGAVNVPGTYLVNPFTTISNALAYSGGVLDYGSLRNIELIKASGEIYSFDLYDLLIFGDRSSDRIIEAGDTIRINGTSNFIDINGEVIRPGIYEYKDDETIKNIIDYSLGLTGLANANKIGLTYADAESLRVLSKEITSENLDIEKARGVLSLTAFGVSLSSDLGILVNGPLENSGYFKSSDYNSLAGLLKDLKFSDNVYPYMAVVEQFDFKNLIKKYHLFSLNDPDTYKDIKLLPNDGIRFFSLFNYGDFINSRLNDETKAAMRDSTLSISYEDKIYSFPVTGRYSIKSFADLIGIEKENIDTNRILISGTTTIKESNDLTDVIKMTENQRIQLFKKSKLQVSGPAKIRGTFDMANDYYLGELLANISFDQSVYPFLGIVENFDAKNLKPSSELFSLSDKDTHNIRIDNNSRIFFLSRDNYNNISSQNLTQRSKDVIEDYLLRINYREQSIDFPVFGNFTVEDVVNYLGLDMNDIEANQTTYVQPLSDVTIVGSYKDLNLVSEKYHSLSFRFKNSDLITVSLSGEVELPGTYTLTPSSTLSDLYKLTGEFKETANLDAIVFTRERVRASQVRALQDARKRLEEYIVNNIQSGNESINASLIPFLEQNILSSDLGRIGGNFKPNTPFANDFLLESGDTIFIARKSLEVTVIGEVLNPNTVLFDKRKSLSEYVQLAGGYKQYANKADVYVIRSNGLIEKKNKNFFLGTTNIQPGDVIVVPRDIGVNNDLLPIITSVTSVISNMAFAAASLNAIQD